MALVHTTEDHNSIIWIPELTDTFRVRIYVHIFLDSIYSRKVVYLGSLVYWCIPSSQNSIWYLVNVQVFGEWILFPKWTFLRTTLRVKSQISLQIIGNLDLLYFPLPTLHILQLWVPTITCQEFSHLPLISSHLPRGGQTTDKIKWSAVPPTGSSTIFPLQGSSWPWRWEEERTWNLAYFRF